MINYDLHWQSDIESYDGRGANDHALDAKHVVDVTRVEHAHLLEVVLEQIEWPYLQIHLAILLPPKMRHGNILHRNTEQARRTSSKEVAKSERTISNMGITS